MGAPLSVENSTDSANEAAQSGLRPGHPCGVPPDKPAPPPAQMAGLRPGLFARARLPPRGALRTAKATRAHRKAVEAFFCRSAGSGKGKRLERAYGASWRFLRTLKLSCRRMAMAQRHGRRDTPPPRRPMAVEREKGACSAYHPSPPPPRLYTPPPPTAEPRSRTPPPPRNHTKRIPTEHITINKAKKHHSNYTNQHTATQYISTPRTN